MSELDGRVAFITGGGRGQGRAHAVTLAREGADVVVCDFHGQLETVPYVMNSDGDLKETCRRVEEVGGRALALNADVRDPLAVDRAVDEAIEQMGHVDILCANAGLWAPAEVISTSDALWRDTIDTNLSGVFHSVRAVGRHMVERGQGGSIVVTSSMAGRQGLQNLGAYCASKFGVIGLVKAAAIELGPHNVRINAVCPSYVDTKMMFWDGFGELFRPDVESPQREDAEEVMRGQHKLPVASFAPEDVSDTVMFLVSDRARFITGSVIDVTAGKGTEWA
jgi:SDR family mycofactocin-dependent oxidoreductase